MRLIGFRPLIRGFFFYNKPCNSNNQFDNSFRPLIRGFFFYYTEKWVRKNWRIIPRFRPLIRGFFFYDIYITHVCNCVRVFPSPHSGILFLSQADYAELCSRIDEVSVPSFGDSFFIRGLSTLPLSCSTGFRPLIRGFFFYLVEEVEMQIGYNMFPSPHSGILFL